MALKIRLASITCDILVSHNVDPHYRCHDGIKEGNTIPTLVSTNLGLIYRWSRYYNSARINNASLN